MGRSIYIDGFKHSNPIPVASRIGNFVASGLITGRAADGELAPSFEGQCRQMLANVRAVLEAAGGDIQSLLRMTVWMNQRGNRDALNDEWLEMYPDPDRRPARMLLNRELGDGKLIECEIIAVLNADEA